MPSRALIRRICLAWANWRSHRCLCRLPAYREAVRAEREAARRGCTRAINLARQAKRRAIVENMKGAV